MNSDPEHPAIEVKINEEASVAKVIVPDGFDPALLEATLLAKLVERCGIPIDSVVESHLLKIVETFRHEPKRLEKVIARSTAPVDGEDGTLEWMEGFDPAAGPAAAVTQDESGAVDYYNQVSYVRVAEGAHVATVHEPTPGEDGLDVTGRTIRARPGRKCDVKIDSGLDVDGSGRVIAQVDGILEYEHGVLTVSRLFEIRGAVDFGTGNVDFDGTVVVREGI
ncbi:MAG: flagellar assembly protein A, partial [Planctomycetota bacterium]